MRVLEKVRAGCKPQRLRKITNHRFSSWAELCVSSELFLAGNDALQLKEIFRKSRREHNRERRAIQNFFRDRKSGAGRIDLQALGRTAWQERPRKIQRRRDLLSDFGECARRRRFCRAAVPPSGGQ